MDDALHQAFISSLKRLFGSKLCPQTVRFLTVGRGAKSTTSYEIYWASTGIGPDLAASVGIWLPGHPVVRLGECRGTPGAVACSALLVGQPTLRTGSDQLPGLQKRPGPSRWSFVHTLTPRCSSQSSSVFSAEQLPFSGGFFVCGLNLTADRCYIAENWKQCLRKLTFGNWQYLKKWLEEQRPGSDPQCVNIIAGDFVGPLPLCPLVIALNQKLLQ